MVRVNLFFESFQDENLKNHTIIRLKGGIQFKITNGWTKPYPAVIDTGAHMSVIPSSILEKIIHEKEGKYRIFGLSKKEECSLGGEIGKVTAIIVDEYGKQTKELSFTAFLAETDQVPIIIGFSGLLEKLNTVFNFNQKIAYIED